VVKGEEEGVKTVSLDTSGAKTFTSQEELGKYLTQQYHIRTPNELSSCETCHR